MGYFQKVSRRDSCIVNKKQNPTRGTSKMNRIIFLLFLLSCSEDSFRGDNQKKTNSQSEIQSESQIKRAVDKRNSTKPSKEPDETIKPSSKDERLSESTEGVPGYFITCSLNEEILRVDIACSLYRDLGDLVTEDSLNGTLKWSMENPGGFLPYRTDNNQDPQSILPAGSSSSPRILVLPETELYGLSIRNDRSSALSQSYPQPPAGIEVQELDGALVVRFKGNPSVGIMLFALALMVALPAFYYSANTMELVIAFALSAPLVLLGVAKLLNTTIITVNDAQLITAARPLPLWPGKSFSVEGIQDFEVKLHIKSNSSGRTFKHYHLFITHETTGRKRLFNFRGDEAPAEFIKDVVRERLGLG